MKMESKTKKLPIITMSSDLLSAFIAKGIISKSNSTCVLNYEIFNKLSNLWGLNYDVELKVEITSEQEADEFSERTSELLGHIGSIGGIVCTLEHPSGNVGIKKKLSNIKKLKEALTKATGFIKYLINCDKLKANAVEFLEVTEQLCILAEKKYCKKDQSILKIKFIQNKKLEKKKSSFALSVASTTSVSTSGSTASSLSSAQVVLMPARKPNEEKKDMKAIVGDKEGSKPSVK